mgnify:CR=1 FL=1
MLDRSKKEEEIKNLEIKQYKAAYVNGHCITNSIKFDDYAKLDQNKAEKEAKERYAKYDQSK